MKRSLNVPQLSQVDVMNGEKGSSRPLHTSALTAAVQFATDQHIGSRKCTMMKLGTHSYQVPIATSLRWETPEGNGMKIT